MKTARGMVLWSAIGLILVAVSGNVQGSLRPWGDAGSLSELQGVFDGIGSTMDAVNDQTTEALFEPTGVGNSTAAYVATVSWSAGDIDFGIYNMDNPNQQVSMFSYSLSPTPGESVVVQFDQGNDWVRVLDLVSLTVYDSSTYFKEFGFYATSYSGTYFSEDNLNYESNAHFLTYEGKGDQVTIGSSGTYSDIDHWYVAAEVGSSGATTGSDFSDMVVQMESITPIPEPSSIAMIGLVSGSALFIRKRFII